MTSSSRCCAPNGPLPQHKQSPACGEDEDCFQNENGPFLKKKPRTCNKSRRRGTHEQLQELTLPRQGTDMTRTLENTNPTLTDEMLVEMTLAGDTRAFDELVSRYQSAFLRVAWNLVKSDTDAQDVVQTAFYNMFRKLDTFKPGSSFKSWAFRVVTNTGLMRLRKRKHRSEIDLDKVHPSYLSDVQPPSLSVAPSWSVRADRLLERYELLEVIDAAVQDLPCKYRQVFVLREYEELSLKEIGDQMDLSIPAVKSRLHRARHFLRTSLEPYVGAHT